MRALAASIGLNVVLLVLAGVLAARAWYASDLEAARVALAQKQGTIDVSNALAGQAATDHTKLLADLEAIAQRGQQVRVDWRTRVVPSLPVLPVECAPGTATQAEFNTLIQGGARVPRP